MNYNVDEVEEIEEPTPKPKNNVALVLLMIGALLITFGIMYPSIMSMMNGGSADTVDQSSGNTETEEPSTTDESTTPADGSVVTTCTAPAQTISANETLTMSATLTSIDSKIKKSGISFTYAFVTADAVYNQTLTACQSALNYNGNPGFTATCDSNATSIVSTQEIDLATFQPITDAATGTSISSTIALDADLNSTIQAYTAQGYTCQ